jgi:hypothetical protein
LRELIEKYKQNALTIDDIFNNASYKNNLTSLLEKFINLKKSFLVESMNSIKLLLKKFVSMNNYIKTLLQFYNLLLKVKIKEIETSGSNSDDASFQLYLINTLFEFDIKCYNDLLNNSELSNLRSDLKTKIQIFERRINDYVSLHNNFKELGSLYLQYPQLLTLQTIEFSIYMFEVALFNENYIFKKCKFVRRHSKQGSFFG